MKTKLLVLGTLMALGLAGCGDSDYEVQMKAKLPTPEVTTVANVDGCVVKYVDRGYDSKSFYLAKCGDTSTMSQYYHVGKTTARKTMITQQINTLTAERAALDQQDNVRQQALGKLTPDERAALFGPASDATAQ
jgi:hypothetical protein